MAGEPNLPERAYAAPASTRELRDGECTAGVPNEQQGAVTKASVRNRAEPKVTRAVAGNKSRKTSPGAGKRTVAAPPAAAPSPAPAPKSYSAADIAKLVAELEAARARITELEAAQRDVLDRIAWAIDSLHSLMEQSPD